MPLSTVPPSGAVRPDVRPVRRLPAEIEQPIEGGVSTLASVTRIMEIAKG